MQHLHAVASNNCTCTHVLRRLQTYQLCKICCVPALAMTAHLRSAYQNYKAWDTYGTDAWWARVFAEPSLACEMIPNRLHSAGLFCPAETTSADIAAGIVVLTHGVRSSTISAAECDKAFAAFKVRRMRMRASHHTSYIKHLNCGGNRNRIYPCMHAPSACCCVQQLHAHMCCADCRRISFARFVAFLPLQ